jgi:catechol 2,3-dioxygenase-like lactoylglutathione lyase family enzyme
MKQFITGIGGVFFRSADPAATYKWYRETLGLPADDYGHLFQPVASDGQPLFTQWSVFPADTNYFGDQGQKFMINYRVQDMEGLIAHLESRGIPLLGGPDHYDYGTFIWIEDHAGNRIELWEPKGGFEEAEDE